jgi:hypothetical protein
MFIVNRIVFILNSIAILALLATYAAPYISPDLLWPVAFLGLAFPAVVLLNVLFIIYWLIFFNMKFLFSLAAIVIGWGHITKFVQLNAKKLEQKQPHSINVITFNARYFGLFDGKGKEDVDIFEQFPLAGFFRYPLSGACPNKVCIMKGYIELTPGQHYAKINGETTWRWQGWNHPLIAPTNEYSVEVNHFKWDSTCIDRIKSVADINQIYSYSKEYQQMYDAIKLNNFKIDIYDERFMIENCGYYGYSQWDKLFKIIQSV